MIYINKSVSSPEKSGDFVFELQNLNYNDQKLFLNEKTSLVYNGTNEDYIGTSRSVFNIPNENSKVIKFAINKVGFIQNKKELEFNSKLMEFAPRIYDHSNDYSFIVVERCIPQETEFALNLGLKQSLFMIPFQIGLDITNINVNYSSACETYEKKYNLTNGTLKNNKLLKNLVTVLVEYGVNDLDFGPGNIGISRIDFRPLILDFVFDEELKDIYFSENNNMLNQ